MEVIEHNASFNWNADSLKKICVSIDLLLERKALDNNESLKMDSENGSKNRSWEKSAQSAETGLILPTARLTRDFIYESATLFAIPTRATVSSAKAKTTFNTRLSRPTYRPMFTFSQFRPAKIIWKILRGFTSIIRF